MLEIRNRTPYQVALVPGLDRDGRDFATVVAKGTFDLNGPSGGPLPLSEEPMPIVWADAFHGEPDASSIRYESDTGPARSGTDVVLLGHAYSLRGRVTQLDVVLRVGPLEKRVRVFGDRRWRRRLGRAWASRPVPFETMPLCYERAFGGADLSHRKPTRHAWEKRNPVGTGFTSAGRKAHFEDLALPNLEDPRALIRRPKQKPPPACFGFVARHWEPRLSYAGTYDERWQAERCPLLPLDFDERHFRSAPPELCAPRHLRGGEAVRAINASPDGELRFALPGVQLEVRAELGDEQQQPEVCLDTVAIEPDLRRVSLTWKATIECARRFLKIDCVAIRELERFA